MIKRTKRALYLQFLRKVDFERRRFQRFLFPFQQHRHRQWRIRKVHHARLSAVPVAVPFCRDNLHGERYFVLVDALTVQNVDKRKGNRSFGKGKQMNRRPRRRARRCELPGYPRPFPHCSQWSGFHSKRNTFPVEKLHRNGRPGLFRTFDVGRNGPIDHTIQLRPETFRHTEFRHSTRPLKRYGRSASAIPQRFKHNLAIGLKPLIEFRRPTVQTGSFAV